MRRPEKNDKVILTGLPLARIGIVMGCLSRRCVVRYPDGFVDSRHISELQIVA